MFQHPCIAILVAILAVLPLRAAEYLARIQQAKTGSTVTLPAGIIPLGDVRVPAGVSLQGAGYGKTILDASGHDTGLVLSGKAPAAVRDLTVRGAGQIGILVEQARGITVERVVTTRCANGLVMRDAAHCTARNLVIAHGRAGASLTRTSNSALVNITFANLEGTAINLTGNTKPAVFNNLIGSAAYGVNVGAGNTGLALDYNLYLCNFVGHLPGHPARKKVESWRDLSGYDAHSLTAAVTFTDAAAGDFRPNSPQPWAPVRATSSDWGVGSLAGVKAPATDIDGAKRQGGIDLGAYEVAFPAPRPADGSLTVTSGAGVTSAGLFTADDRCVRTLFQNLPLAKGKYAYWLPSRDWQGRPIPAGAYTVKLTEANLRLAYVAAAGNGDLPLSTGPGHGVEHRATLDAHTLAFDDAGHLLMAQSGFESGQFVRCYDAEMRTFLWSIPGGGSNVGMTTDPRGRVYVWSAPAKLIRLRGDTGAGINFTNGGCAKEYPNTFSQVAGITWLEETLYVADQGGGKLVALTGDDLQPTRELAVPEPSSPAADAANKIVWVISAGKDLIAFDARGQRKVRATPVEQPRLLAVANGRLAVYSAATRKISIFACGDSADLRLLHTIGTGDDGFGPIRGDRFWSPTFLAMNAKGEVAVVDRPRVIMFNADGTVKRQQMGMWGQQMCYGYFAHDDRTHAFNIGGGYSIIFDPKAHRWEPGTHWRYTMSEMAPLFFFTTGGQNFGLFQRNLRGVDNYVVLVRMEADGTGRVLARYGWGKDGMYLQRDPDGDGVINETDPTEPVLEANGTPVTERLIDRGFNNIDYRADGAMAIPRRNGVLVIPMTGLDAQGVPHYDLAHRQFIRGTVEDGKATFVSPYDFTTKETVSIAEDMSVFPDGRFTAVMTTQSGPGPDVATEHANGTSMAGFDATGKMRWFSPLNPYGLKMGFWGITTIGGITFAGRGAIMEYETMDIDGLGTGVLGTPPALGWLGTWLDNHRQTFGFTGNDGKPYLVIGDYAQQAYHWLELKGWDTVRHATLPVTISPATAAALQAAPAQPVPAWLAPPPPRLTINKLAAPLPIDGDVEKWRKLNIPPIIITPDGTASGDPRDTCAIVRLAYEGENLYLHMIKFDNVLTFHQSNPGAHYLQDGLEMAINTYMEGWKYNITRLSDGTDMILRDRRGSRKQLTPEEAPRVIRTLDSAERLADRALIEAAYGVDMRACKALIIECKLPKAVLADMQYKQQVEFSSGKSFLLGFMINDNDTPGADTLNPIVWPVTYGTYERIEKHATAVFE